jgi:hypothetical protein
MVAGSIGFFVFVFLAFIRALPAISIFEMREIAALVKAGARPTD